MSSEVIPCPACGHSVRVPESLFGQAVRCPQCKAYFTAPVRDASGLMGTPELLDGAPPLPQVQPAADAKPRERSTMFLPAVMLILVGLLGTGVNGVMLAFALSDPEAFRNQQLEGAKMFAQLTGKPLNEDAVKENAGGVMVALGAFTGMGVLTLLGGLATFSCKAWPLAVLGSIVAIVNLGQCCCLFGAPVGIYSLFKLFDPENRLLFKRD